MSLNPFKQSHDGVDVVNVLGVGISPVSMETAVDRLVGWAREGFSKTRYVCVSGVHGVIEAQRDPALRTILNRSDLNVPDGMPLVWIGKAAGVQGIGRVFGPDLMLRFCEAAAHVHLRHFFYGGNEGVADELAHRLSSAYPGTKVVGTFCPPFRPLSQSELEAIVATINAAAPDVVWVGLSTPKQERWMASVADKLRVKILLGVGAAFDFNTGRLKRAPSWMQQSGLEWLYRMVQEPRRLSKRYLVNNPLFIVLVIQQALGLRRPTLDAE